MAGDEEHPQPVAHAVDRQDSAIVEPGQLAGKRRRLDLQDRPPRLVEREGQRERNARPRGGVVDDIAVNLEGHADRRVAGRAGSVLDPDAHALRLTDHREARGLLDDECPIRLVLSARQKHMQRRIDRGGVLHRRHVMDLAVGERDHGREPAPVDLGQGFVHVMEQVRAVAAAGNGDLMHLDVAELGQARSQRSDRGLHLGRALLELLARRLVEDEESLIGKRIVLFLAKDGIGERAQEKHRKCQPPRPPLGPAIGTPGKEHSHRDGQANEDPDRKVRLENKAQAGHWPNRSRRAGTCTWSVL